MRGLNFLYLHTVNFLMIFPKELVWVMVPQGLAATTQNRLQNLEEIIQLYTIQCSRDHSVLWYLKDILRS